MVQNLDSKRQNTKFASIFIRPKRRFYFRYRINGLINFVESVLWKLYELCKEIVRVNIFVWRNLKKSRNLILNLLTTVLDKMIIKT